MGEIHLDGVSVAYDDVVAVEGIDLRVEDGELLVLVGPSGCGKTTLLRAIAGLEDPTHGEVVIDERRVTALPARKRDVGLVFQDFALFPHLSVRENLSFNLRMQDYDRVDERVDEVADLLEIESLLDRSVDALSGGQKGRVALGRAIVTEPTAFLLDEPLANLDAGLRERMRTEIARLQADLDVTTVHVTHDQGEALTMGDRVAVMNDGRIEQVGTPEAIYREPASLFVAEFVGSPSMNRLRGRYDADAGAVRFDADEGAVPPDADRNTAIPVTLADATDGREVVLGVRPEAVAVDTPPDRDRAWTTATVGFEEFHGADRFLYLAAPGLPELVTRVASEEGIHVGDEVGVRLPADRLHAYDAATGSRLAVTGSRLEPGEGGTTDTDEVETPERERP